MEAMERLIDFDVQMLVDSAGMAISIFILFFGLSYLLFNPLKNVLEKRRERIAAQLAQARESREDALALKADYEARMLQAEKEAGEILEEARKKGKSREEEIIRQAREEAERIMGRAHREIDLEKKKARDSLKNELVELASLMAEKAVGRSVSLSLHGDLIQETLREMGESTWQN